MGATPLGSGGIGLSSRSVSQASAAIHQRWPSLTSWMLWMPRAKGAGSFGARTVSYVEKTWHTSPNRFSRRAISRSVKPSCSPFSRRPAMYLRIRSSKPFTSRTVNASASARFGGTMMASGRNRARSRFHAGSYSGPWLTD